MIEKNQTASKTKSFTNDRPAALTATEAPLRAKPSNYPEPFATRMAGREKRPLGDLFQLSNFGVNLTRLRPGSISALRHAHSQQDEFIYIISGMPTLITDAGEIVLQQGMCAGFPGGDGDAHHLINHSNHDVWYLEVGDRTAGDEVTYPDDDLVAALDTTGKWRFFHKDGQSY